MLAFLTGKKTYIGAALVAAGVAGELVGLTGLGTVIASIGGALGIVGVGHKADRLMRIIKEIIDLVNEVRKGN